MNGKGRGADPAAHRAHSRVSSRRAELFPHRFHRGNQQFRVLPRIPAHALGGDGRVAALDDEVVHPFQAPQAALPQQALVDGAELSLERRIDAPAAYERASRIAETTWIASKRSSTGLIGMARCVAAASSVPGSSQVGAKSRMPGWRWTGVR